MQVDEQKLLQLIGDNPMIRTVQLAERLDCDIEDVVDALIAQTNRGRVLDHQVMAPNNRRATAYTLSSEFRGEILRHVPGVPIDPPAPHITRAIAFVSEHGTVTGAQLHARLELDPAATPSHVLAEALADGRLHKDGKNWTLGPASRAALIAPAEGEADQKVASALALLTEFGFAGDEQMRKAMGITGRTAPAAYLFGAVALGKLHKYGGAWKLGPAPAQAPEARSDFKGLPDSLIAQLSKPVQELVRAQAEQFAAGELPEAERVFDIPPHMVSLTTPAKAAPFPTTTFRCGLWSDGSLELHRDGKPIAALSPDECEQVKEFLGKRAA